MQVKHKNLIARIRAKDTRLTTLDGKVTLTHHQLIRQSANYQSAEASYGATITVADDKASIAKATARIERLVETALVNKVQEQQAVLTGLANANGK